MSGVGSHSNFLTGPSVTKVVNWKATPDSITILFKTRHGSTFSSVKTKCSQWPSRLYINLATNDIYDFIFTVHLPHSNPAPQTLTKRKKEEN